VPLAAVLWNGGISFGGVVAFLFADLIVLPILDIYRKYYGMRVAALLFGLFYVAMAAAGYIVESLFGVARLVSQHRGAQVRRPCSRIARTCSTSCFWRCWRCWSDASCALAARKCYP